MFPNCIFAGRICAGRSCTRRHFPGFLSSCGNFLSIRSRINVGGIPYSTDEKTAPHLSLFVQVGLALENLIQ